MSRIASFCADYIGKHGPTSVHDLYQAAHAAQVTTARTPAGVMQAVRRGDMFVQLPDGRYTTASRLLVGSVFTHRVRRDYDGASYLSVGAELDPLQPLVEELRELPVEGGGSVSLSAYRSTVWDVPPRLVQQVPIGGLVGFRWTGTHLRIGPAEFDPVDDQPRAQEARTVLIRQRRRRLKELSRNYGYASSQPENMAALVLSALAEAPTLFSGPVPPLDELLGQSPSECLDELYRSIKGALQGEHRIQISLDLPEPLFMELEARANRMRISPKDFISGLLGHEMWRTAPWGTVPYQPRYRRDNDERHLSVVPAWDEPWRPDSVE